MQQVPLDEVLRQAREAASKGAAQEAPAGRRRRVSRTAAATIGKGPGTIVPGPFRPIGAEDGLSAWHPASSGGRPGCGRDRG